ncbi:MAG: regulatory protein RecX [Spirochaetales bacterium]|nr:regulatory protein RecX [Spirochaetales bacterium]
MSIENYENKLFIETVKRGRESDRTIPGCRLVLSDGSTYFILLSDADNLGCLAGTLVDLDLRSQLHAAAFRWKVAGKALDLLANREHSRMELRQKIEKKLVYKMGLSDSEIPENAGGIINEVLDSLEEKGYLNDKRFALYWTESRLRRHPEGRSALMAGLRARGVSGNISSLLIEELDKEGAFEKALCKAGEKLSRRSSLNRERLVKRLQARGFGYREVRDWVAENFQEPGREDTNGEDSGFGE